LSPSSDRVYRLYIVLTSLSQSQRPILPTNHFHNILSSSLFVPHKQLQLTNHSFISRRKHQRSHSRSDSIPLLSISPTSFHPLHTHSTSRQHRITPSCVSCRSLFICLAQCIGLQNPFKPVTLRSLLSRHSRTLLSAHCWVFVLCALHCVGDCQRIISGAHREGLFYSRTFH